MALGIFRAKLHDIMDDDGGDAPVCHSGCYCTYTSKAKIEKFKKSKKRKAEDAVVRMTTRCHTDSTADELI